MTAIPKSGRSDQRNRSQLRVRFQPEADNTTWIGAESTAANYQATYSRFSLNARRMYVRAVRYCLVVFIEIQREIG